MDIIKKDLVTKFLSCIKGACMNITLEKSLNCALDSFSGLVESIEESSESSSSVGPTPIGPDYLRFVAERPNCKLCLMGISLTEFLQFELEWSTDQVIWNSLNFFSTQEDDNPDDPTKYITSDILTFENVGDTIYFRGNNEHGTYYINDQKEPVYMLMFAGDENKRTVENVFGVYGDIQTIVDKTGQNKTAGSFYNLFGTYVDFEIQNQGIMITHAPDLTATTLVSGCYYAMFNGQSMLTAPARMPKFQLSDLPLVSSEDESLTFAYMYAGTALEYPCNFTAIQNNDEPDLGVRLSTLDQIYVESLTKVTNDDVHVLGFTDLFLESIQISAFEFCKFLGSVNGFSKEFLFNEGYSFLHLSTNNPEDTIVVCDNNDFPYDNFNTTTAEKGVETRIMAYVRLGNTASFVKWQHSIDGENWEDVPDGGTYNITIQYPFIMDAYYKAIFNN